MYSIIALGLAASKMGDADAGIVAQYRGIVPGGSVWYNSVCVIRSCPTLANTGF